MKVLSIIALATGLAIATPAAFAQDMMAPTMEEVASAGSATIVEVDSATPMPDVMMDYDIADLQQWLGTNTALTTVFENSEYTSLDVIGASFADGVLTLYVDPSTADEAE